MYNQEEFEELHYIYYPQRGMKIITIFIFSSFLFCILTISSAADTITANQTIRDGDGDGDGDGETIVSARGEFEMGFFSTPGYPNNLYFGIWYKKISAGTVVWVANRDTPIANRSGIIRVTAKGITLSTNNISVIWSSNYSRSVKNPVAQLLDTGNLVFRDQNESDQQNFVWQSFDYPVDNVLPTMKFGLVRGINKHLISWKSDDNPSPGEYKYTLDPNGYPQQFLYKDSVASFRTGPWVGTTFSGTPTQAPNGIYTYNFSITPKETYYVFYLVNTSESAISRLIMTPAGVLRRLIWSKQKKEWTVFLTAQGSDCDRYGYCGAYGVCNINKTPRCDCMKGFNPKNQQEWATTDWSSGCLRNVQLNCTNGDGFLKYSGVKLPDTQGSWYNTSMNLDECKSVCLKNCNCTAYSNIDVRNGGSGCLIWFGGLIDIRGYSEDGQDMYVRMAASELNSSYTGGNNKFRQKKKVRTILIPVFVVLTVILSLFFLYAFKNRWFNRNGEVQPNEMQNMDLPVFDLRQISNATDNFSSNNKLGEGGFGSVYKGILKEGQEIAVKRLSKDSRQGVDEFINEVSCIAKLQHRNLVRLLGCCIEEGERLLIYEYMPNKSLDFFIFDEKMCKSFDWLKRYNIINGIAKGLLYLHHDSRLRIIHRDLKVSNILLDFEMNPKISDFGLARIFGESETEANTARVVGTYGYMPPEYAIDGVFSVKSDVYSFGVLLLEIISGKKNRSFSHPDHSLNLIGHVWKSYNDDKLVEVVDSTILNSSNEQEVFRVIQIGLLCVQEYPDDRPNMSSTFSMLTSNNALPQPKQPGFFTERKRPRETDSSSSNPAYSSLNDITVSYFGPR